MPKLAEGNVTIVQSFKGWLTPDYVPHIIVYKMRLREKKVYPLFFLHRHADKSYHIDYAFVTPERIRDCYIETTTNWLAISDHRPLILEIED